jgi:hypothetical protein
LSIQTWGSPGVGAVLRPSPVGGDLGVEVADDVQEQGPLGGREHLLGAGDELHEEGLDGEHPGRTGEDESGDVVRPGAVHGGHRTGHRDSCRVDGRGHGSFGVRTKLRTLLGALCRKSGDEGS